MPDSELSTVIHVDIIHTDDNQYDVYLATDSSSGCHYENATAEQIGDYVTSMIKTLEDEYVKK